MRNTSDRHLGDVPDVQAGLAARSSDPVLPRAGASAAGTPREPEPESSPGGGSTTGLPRRVLLAEDNRDLMQIFARQLNMLGLEVLGVSNGRDAVELTLAALAAGNPFDLVLMDLEMPIIDGYEATRRLRGGGFSGPIVALTAHSTDDNRLECLELGCDDCLCKPIDWNRLGGVIRQFIPDLRAGQSSLDPDD